MIKLPIAQKQIMSSNFMVITIRARTDQYEGWVNSKQDGVWVKMLKKFWLKIWRDICKKIIFTLNTKW
jgi:hypothetical protein